MGRLQTARLENFIRRWGSIKGPGSVLSETLGDVFPVLDLENVTAENMLTAGWSLVAGSATATGGVAQLAALQMVNPAGSASLLVVTRITLQAPDGHVFQVGINTPLTTAIACRNMDGRATNVFNGNAVIAASTNATASTGAFNLINRAGIEYVLDVPGGIAVLGPGDALQLTASVANKLIRATFFGRVRLAEPSELSF